MEEGGSYIEAGDPNQTSQMPNAQAQEYNNVSDLQRNLSPPPISNTDQFMPIFPPRYDDIYYPRTDKRMIKGNQYTYVGNSYMNKTNQPQCVEESIEKIIENQEMGRSPYEYSNVLSRAKGKVFVQLFSHGNEKSKSPKVVHKLVASSMKNKGLEILKQYLQMSSKSSKSSHSHKSEVKTPLSVGGLRVSSTKDDTNYNLRSAQLQVKLDDIIADHYDEEINNEIQVDREEDGDILQKVESFDNIGLKYKQNPFQERRASSFAKRGSRLAPKIPQSQEGLLVDSPAPIDSSRYKMTTKVSEEVNADLLYNSISLHFGKDHEVRIKAKQAAKLFYLSKEQMLKAILMSLDFQSDEISIEGNRLQEIVTALDYPPYRNVFTKANLSNICYLKDQNTIGRKLSVELEMPYMQMTLKGDQPTTYMKYLEPLEFNVFIQEKFENWNDQIVEYFQKRMGKNFEDHTGKCLVKENGVCMFERSKGEHIIFEKELNSENSHSVSSLVVTEKAKDSDSGTYMRFEGFQLVLSLDSDGQNLNSIGFNLGKETELILQLMKKSKNLIKIFQKEIKIFYNSASEFWRMYLDLESIVKKYLDDPEYDLKEGEAQKRGKLECNSTCLDLIFVQPRVFHANKQTNYNEKETLVKVEKLEEMSEGQFKNWEEVCYSLIKNK